MASSAYLKLKGQKQGDIKGPVTRKGLEGTIEVIAANHEVRVPKNAGSGMTTGKRQHKPFVIVKEVDKATPLLYTALVNSENLSTWELRFYRASSKGAEKNHWTVALTNATVAEIRFVMPNVRESETATRIEYEEIAFTYQKIKWTWTDGGTTATDNWAPQNA